MKKETLDIQSARDTLEKMKAKKKKQTRIDSGILLGNQISTQ